MAFLVRRGLEGLMDLSTSMEKTVKDVIIDDVNHYIKVLAKDEQVNAVVAKRGAQSDLALKVNLKLLVFSEQFHASAASAKVMTMMQIVIFFK